MAVTDPYLPDPSFQNLQIKADVTTLSLIGPKIRTLVAASRHEVYTIQGPGEYEIGGIFVRGLPTHRPSAESNGQDAGYVYRYTVDGISICHLGQLNAPPDQEVIDQFGSPQVLIIPPGGPGAFSRADAIRLVSAMTPSYVIPMGYAAAKPAENEEAITGFLRELGMDLPEPATAFTIRRGALPAENLEVVRLESRAKLKRPVGEKT